MTKSSAKSPTTTLELIRIIQRELNKNPPLTWKSEGVTAEFLVRAFYNMRRLAIDLGYDLGGTKSYEEAEKTIDAQFEELMDE